MAPIFFTSRNDTMPDMMEKNTSGQTIHLIRFRKIVPNGLI